MKVLALSPHTDDIEIGCGGTIARHIAEGDSVYYVAFTALDDDRLKAEVKKATARLGVPAPNLIVWDYPVRRFATKRQEILTAILALKDAVKPDRVYMPCLHDLHQDHGVVAAEAVRALRNVTLLGYEMPRNNLHFNAQAFVVLNDDHVEAKVQSVWMYDSQRQRTYTTADAIESQARFRGIQIDQKWAEAFEVIRWVR